LTPAGEWRRRRELSNRLHRDGYSTFPVIGASADLSHQQIGEGIPTGDLCYLSQITREFAQWGFFWVGQGQVYICVDGSGEGWMIGLWLERLIDKFPALPRSVLPEDVSA